MSLSEALAGIGEPPATENAAPATGNVDQGTEGGPSLSYIGFEAEEPKAQDAAPIESKWEVKLPPDAVVAVVDGKPLTASEVEKSFMLQSDYTRKTQEVAEQRKEMAQIAEAWESQVLPVMQGLQSEDMQTRKDTLLNLAQSYGIDLAPRARGADGRFAASEKPDDGMIDLSQFEEGSEAWILAAKLNQQTEQQNSMRQAWERQESQAKEAQTRAEMEAMASSWKAAGLDGADTKAAQALVGKNITPEQAMKLSHWDAILRHTAKVAQSMGSQSAASPDEPRSGQRTPGTQESLKGKSLMESFRIRGLAGD